MQPIASLIDPKRAALAAIDESALFSAVKPAALRMYPASAREDDYGISVYYAPFDAVNLNAKVVLVGITPGESQMHRAWIAARSATRQNKDIVSAVSEVKRLSSFNDKKNQMRPNLYATIEHWGIHRWLGLESGASLFGEGWGLVQTTSLVQFPTFVKDKNYEGKSPSVLDHEFLRAVVRERLVPELRSIPNALLLPLGSTVESAIRKLFTTGDLKNPCIYGMLHPSGNNTYRRKYLCGDRKEPVPHATNAEAYDAGRHEFRSKYLPSAL